MDAHKIRMPLSRKFAVGFVCITIVICGLLGLVGYLDISRLYRDFYSDKAASAATLAASVVTGEDAAHYLSTLETDDRYDALLTRLTNIKNATGVQWLYVFYPAEDGYLYLFDAPGRDDPSEDLKAIGSTDAYTAGNSNMMRVMTSGERVSQLLVTDTSLGYVGTIFAPIPDADGKSVALVGVDVSMADMNSSLRSYLLRTLLAFAGSVTIILLLYLLYIRRSLIRPLRSLTTGVQGFVGQQDQLSYTPAPIHTGDEVEVLSDAFTQMAEDLGRYVANLKTATAEKERIETELNIASDIQMSMLPRIFPPFPQRTDFTIYATIEPAKEVGGDFYDFFLLDEQRLCFLIADVSGKGVPAALFMMLAKALVKNEMQKTQNLEDAFNTANDQLCEGNDQCMFVTSMMFLLDLSAGTLSYINAGHNPPLIRRRNGAFAYLDVKKSLPLAAFPHRQYQACTVPFSMGDTLYTYTDGVTEALNPQTELFGEERLLNALNELPSDVDAVTVVKQMGVRLKSYVSGAEQSDDITMLAVHVTTPDTNA